MVPGLACVGRAAVAATAAVKVYFIDAAGGGGNKNHR